MRKTLIILGTLLVAILLALAACAPAPAPTPAPAPEPTPAPAPPTPEPTPALSYSEICLELSRLCPELALELERLPEIRDGVSEEDLEALNDICSLYVTSPETREAFQLMMDEGIKTARKYCTLLQALLWLAYDKEFDRYNPLKDYSLEKLLDDAWKNTATSDNYKSERWQDFDEVVDRLNSPELITIYLQDNFTYSYERGEPEGVKSAQQILNEKKGACYDHALLAGYCLKMNGYDETRGLRVRYERIFQGYFIGHIVLVFQDPTDSLYYTVDNIGGSVVHGPFESVEEAAEYSVREQGLTSYALGDIDLEIAKYKTTCQNWVEEHVVLVTEPVLEEEEIELKYDDGQARDSISTVSPSFGGHIVDFSPPATPFTIKKIRIAGLLSSFATGLEGKTFDLQILDKNLKVLHSTTYPYTKFPFSSAATWVEFEVPNIEVADKFYVHIYTDSPYPGLHIGADDSVVNQHSDVTVRTAEGAITILTKWPYTPSLWFGDKSKVSWMIKVIGTTEVSLD